MITPSGRNVTRAEREEREEEREKMPLIVDTTFGMQCPRAAHALRSDQFLRSAISDQDDKIKLNYQDMRYQDKYRLILETINLNT